MDEHASSWLLDRIVASATARRFGATSVHYPGSIDHPIGDTGVNRMSGSLDEAV